MTNLPFGIALLVLAILSVIMPYFCDDDEERKGISVDINENGDLLF